MVEQKIKSKPLKVQLHELSYKLHDHLLQTESCDMKPSEGIHSGCPTDRIDKNRKITAVRGKYKIILKNKNSFCA